MKVGIPMFSSSPRWIVQLKITGGTAHARRTSDVIINDGDASVSQTRASFFI